LCAAQATPSLQELMVFSSVLRAIVIHFAWALSTTGLWYRPVLVQ